MRCLSSCRSAGQDQVDAQFGELEKALTLNVESSRMLVRLQDLVAVEISGFACRHTCPAFLFVDKTTVNLGSAVNFGSISPVLKPHFSWVCSQVKLGRLDNPHHMLLEDVLYVRCQMRSEVLCGDGDDGESCFCEIGE